ncbi:LysR family transcriptional regulator [Erwinia sp. D4-22]
MLNNSKEFRSSTDDLAFFLKIVSLGSLTAAARELGLSLPAVSKRLGMLEQRLGVQLLLRTTRRLELTSEGLLYYEGAKPILDQLTDLENTLTAYNGPLKGALNIHAPFGFGRKYIAPCVSAFALAHQEVDIHLTLSNQTISLTDSSIDIDIRMENPPDARVIARKIAANPRVVCASPAYLARYPAPRCVADLADHNCILLKQYESDFALWRFSKDNKAIVQKVKGRLTTNDGEVAMRMALEGHGLIMRSWWDAKKYILSGELVQVLQEYRLPDGDVYAIYQARKRVPLRIAAFIDYLLQSLTDPTAVSIAAHLLRAP